MLELDKRYQQVKTRIKLASQKLTKQTTPKLLAVSKKHGVEKIKALVMSGQLEYGESYAQEGVEKIKQLSQLPLVWHFIGPIQSNKTKIIAENFDWIHSVDRMKVLLRLIRQRPMESGRLNLLLQLKIGDEASKSGADYSEIKKMAAVIGDANGCVFRGLMCIPPPSSDFAEQKAYFQQAKHQFDELAKQYPTADTLSMGMSSDLEAAIASGSTLIRVGTDIFGQRV